MELSHAFRLEIFYFVKGLRFNRGYGFYLSTEALNTQSLPLCERVI